MAGMEKTRDAISVSLSDSNFSAVAARLTGAPLRHAIAARLASQGIDVVVIAAIGDDDATPYRQAEIVWQSPDGGDFVRQTIRWNLASWAFAAEADVAKNGGRQSAQLGGLRALRLTALGRS
jgi:hypothetical protein